MIEHSEQLMPYVAHIVADLDEIEADEAAQQAWPAAAHSTTSAIVRWWWNPPARPGSRAAARAAGGRA